jgi:hypothetical protein
VVRLFSPWSGGEDVYGPAESTEQQLAGCAAIAAHRRYDNVRVENQPHA